MTASPPLTGTEWRIIEIAGETIAPAADARPARLRLDGGEARFAASAGCNNLMGSYALDGASLTFGPAAMTMMMCDDTLMQRERALVDALTAARTYRIDADTLALLDAAGVPLVRAEASEGGA